MDIFPAKILGMRTILVNPFSQKDPFLTKIISRPLEKMFLRGQF
jgi:predicted HAD superfamily phosphohydrolase YqeG